MRALPTAASTAVAAVFLLAGCATISGRHATAVDLDAILAGPRPTADRSCDRYRHPVQTLLFFGLRPTTRAMQVWPRSGYYTRIIAPLVRRHGLFYAALIAPDDSPFLRKRAAAYRTLLASQPNLYDRVRVVVFPANGGNAVAPGSVNMVLAFGALHKWLAEGIAREALTTINRALVRGGVFGVVDNRADPAAPVDRRARNGYVNQSYAIRLIQSYGFRLVATSEVNANPRDTKHYPAGVWTLPPDYRLGALHHRRYRKIGEADRFTLKFVKAGNP
jgi:predicted methyltransferase